MIRAVLWLALWASLLLSVACGPRVSVETDASWAHAPDLDERVSRVVYLASQRWGGSAPFLRVKIVDDACSGTLGCEFDHLLGDEVQVSTWTKYDGALYLAPCVEQTSLAHEVGHAVVGDANHLDLRWRSGWEPLWTELTNMPGCPALPYRGTWEP